MANLHVGDNDLHGNRFNGHDLHQYLREWGVDSNHLVWDKLTDDSHTFELAGDEISPEHRNFLRRMSLFFNDAFSTQALFYPLTYQMMFHPLFLKAHVVHYHLIQNHFFDMSFMPILSRLKPTVWSVHDPWALAGHCIHSGECDRWKMGCGDCPNLGSPFPIQQDSTALNWEIKSMLLSQCDMDIVVGSEWMEDRVKDSPLFENSRIHLLPYGLDLGKFKPLDSATCKKKLGIDPESVVVAFRASPIQFKGLNFLRKCLDRLKTDKKITLLTFDKTGLLEEEKAGFRVVELGWIKEEEKMVEAYNGADIFLMPSSAESFGVMAMEAMACGKPCIVTSGTALEGTVMAQRGGGMVIPQGDLEKFTQAISHLVDNESLRREMGEKALKLAREKYDINHYLCRITEIYRDAIERKKTDRRSQYIVGQLEKMPRRVRPFEQLEGLLSLKKNLPTLPPYEEDHPAVSSLLTPLESILLRGFPKIKRIKILRSFYFKFVKPLLFRQG